MSYYLWKQWQINLSSVTIFRYPKQVQVSLKELNFRLKERKTVGSGQGFVPPQHLWPRLRGVFFPRDKSGPACHMSTIHPPPLPEKRFPILRARRRWPRVLPLLKIWKSSPRIAPNFLRRPISSSERQENLRRLWVGHEESTTRSKWRRATILSKYGVR